ncbi:MBL fold metallo-hydrolase [Bacillus sp. 2205SS5-2]|uniref:MBL fold metallo-hydrolase n=1 Tax=Bacillus sp. 2205SS5-2 TaxID=3109031 RepID=UPI003005EC25
MNSKWYGNIGKIVIPTPFAVGNVNAYVIKSDVLTLIDAGPKTDEAWEAMKSGLSHLGYCPEDIEQVVLTHHHPDHAGLLDYFSHEVPVYGHSYNQDWLLRTEAFFKRHDDFYAELFLELGLPQQFLIFLDRLRAPLKWMCQRTLTGVLQEGDAIPGLQEWKVIETLGHAQSHLSFYREKDGVLIAGDHLIAHISSNPLIEPAEQMEQERPMPQVQYNASLRKMLEYDISLAFSGHGSEINAVHELVNRRLERQHVRAMKVRDMLVEEPKSCFDICQKLFPEIFKKELGLTMSETLGQLDYLLDVGEVSVTHNEYGVAMYSA